MEAERDKIQRAIALLPTLDEQIGAAALFADKMDVKHAAPIPYRPLGVEKDFLDFITKEASPEQFKEDEHPRDAHGRFRDKNEGVGVKEQVQEQVAPKTEKIKEHTKQDINYLEKWASTHKGTIVAATVTAPLVLTSLKIGSRFVRMLYNKETKQLVSWDKLTKQERMEFMAQAQPGDVFLQSSKVYPGLLSYLKDVAKVIKDDPNKVKWTVQDPLGRAIENVEYPHSALVVGRYDEAFHKKMVDILNTDLKGVRRSDPIRTEQEMVKHVYRLSFIKKTEEERAAFEKLMMTPEGQQKIWNDLQGKLILAIGSTNPKHQGTLRLTVQGMPFGGGVGAILRTKVPLSEREEMCQKIKTTYFARAKTDPKIQFAIDEERKPTDKRNLDIMFRNTFYPFFEPFKGKFSEKVLWKDDAMVCHGSVAALYEQFAGVKLGKEFRYMTANDLISDKRFADLILEMKKVGEHAKPSWTTAEELKKRHQLTKTQMTAGVAGGSYLVHSAIPHEDTTTKGMTAEQFDEDEHPRDASGRFTDKVGGGGVFRRAEETPTEPSPDKGTWGGG